MSVLPIVLLGLLSGVTSDPSLLADIGPAPEVSLIDAKGRPFRLSDLRGRAVVVSFVYTTCDGSCPATTRELVRVQGVLKAAGLWGERARFVSISLDPDRDTPEVLAAYGAAFGVDPDAWHLLTGPPARVEKVVAAWDMWARRNAAGVLDHPSRIFLVDPKGRQREIYNLETLSPADVLRDVRAVLAGPG